MTNRIRAAACALTLLVLCSACASTSTGGAVPRPFPMPGGSPAAPAAPDPSAHPADPALPPHPVQAFDGYALVGTALALRGTPYRSGGSDPHGFDCSGFTQFVYAQYGVSLARDVAAQFRQGKTVKPDAIAPGDLLFFATLPSGASGPSHVAIAVGADEFVHAPSSTGVVRVERLSSSYWSPKFLGARRVGER